MALTPGEYVQRLKDRSSEDGTDLVFETEWSQRTLQYPEGRFLYNGEVFSTEKADLLYSRETKKGRSFMFRCQDGQEFMIEASEQVRKTGQSLFHGVAFVGATFMLLSHMGLVAGFLFPMALLGVLYGVERHLGWFEYTRPTLDGIWKSNTPFEKSFIRSFEANLPRSAIKPQDENGVIEERPYHLELDGYGKYSFTEHFVRLYNEQEL